MAHAVSVSGRGSYDIVVIGAGPAGRAAALEAAAAGARVAVAERRAPGERGRGGGTIPAKTLRFAALDAFAAARHGRGERGPTIAALNWPTYRSLAAEAETTETRLREAGCAFLQGTARFID